MMVTDRTDFGAYASIYRDHLLNNVVPFWLKNSPDKEFGGYLTCLDREGKVYDTDKFIWLQCRQVWTFSMLYNQVEKKGEWLDFAVQGAEFLMRHGRDKQGHWFFSLTRDGRPLVQPYNIFSDCFAAMAFARLHKATAEPKYEKIARDSFLNILERQHNPKGIYAKGFPGTRPLQGFALPMILSNLVLEMEHILEPDLAERVIERGIHAVMEVFYRSEQGVILENVHADGSFSDSLEGRLVNPGHGLESMWFMMDLAVRSRNPELLKKAVSISLDLMEYGWDQKHGGIFYFLDVKGCPPQQLEWDQKLWWVHLEAIITMLKVYLLTGDKRCLEWFKKLHEYSFDHFSDKEGGEWFGYLNRRGEILLDLKGGKWKGCFHVPRAFYQAWKTLDAINDKSIADKLPITNAGHTNSKIAG